MTSSSLSGLLICLLFIFLVATFYGSVYFAVNYGEYDNKWASAAVIFGYFLMIGGLIFVALGFNDLVHAKNLTDALLAWAFAFFFCFGVTLYLIGMYKAYKGFRNNK